MHPRLRTLTIGSLIAALAAASGSAATAAPSPAIYVNGAEAAVTAIVRKNHVYVPVRGVFERIGAQVDYTPPSAVRARTAQRDVARLSLGSTAATVNGTPSQLATAPFRAQGRIYVPLRLISEAAGATVAYTAAPREVRITNAHLAAAPLAAGAAGAAAGAAAAAAAGTAAPTEQHASIPWWVWLLLALVVLAAVLAFMRRRKSEPVITTRSSVGDATIVTRR